MKKMAGVMNVAEIDFYQVSTTTSNDIQFLDFKKKHQDDFKGKAPEEEDKEALFTLGGDLPKGETDPYRAYVKMVIDKARQ